LISLYRSYYEYLVRHLEHLSESCTNHHPVRPF